MVRSQIRHTSVRALVCLVAAVLATSAQGAMKQVNIDFTATGFAALFDTGTVPPTDPVAGSLSILFDDSLVPHSGSFDLDDLELQTLSMSAIDGHTYTAAESGAGISFVDGQVDRIAVGALLNSYPNAASATNDYFANFYPAWNVQGFSSAFLYTSENYPADFFMTESVNANVRVTAVVPVPSGLVLGIVGLATIGAFRKRLAR
jgi:hypothetical protein